MIYLIFITCIGIICGSALWSSGGIILLDYIFTDHVALSIFQPLGILIPNLLSRIFGYEIASKGFYVLILVVSGILGMLFARKIADSMKLSSGINSLLQIVGILFFLTNPFAYERMMVQPLIYLGVIALGYGIYFLFFEKKYILAGIAFGLALASFPHAAFMIALICILYIVFFIRSSKELLSILMIGGLITIINLNWLIAPIFSLSNSLSTISSFTLANFEAFQTQALSPLDVFSTNILLYGFWGEHYANHYARVDILSSLWYVAGLVLISMVILGIFILWKSGKKKEAWVSILVGGVSLVLAIGIASPVTAPLTRLLIEYVPYFSGYREPQKWIGLLTIVEGIGFLIASGYLLKKFRHDIFIRYTLFISSLLLIIIWSPGPLFSYHGQLRTTVYPEAFTTLRTDLLEEGFHGKILALPWHSYMGCEWTGRPTIANPITSLLSPLPIVSSDNIEIANILYTNSQNQESHLVELFLSSHDFSSLLGQGFTYILFMKGCGSLHEYDWIGSISNCNTVRENSSLVLYHCHS